MSEQIFALLFGFVILPIACIALERAWPQVRGARALRPQLAADALWYLVQTAVSRLVAPWVVFYAVLPVFLIAGLPLQNFWSGFGPASRLPFAAQVAIVFVVADFLSYWQHRFFHTRLGWPIHAVHHSSDHLDWLSSTRFHPLNEIGVQVILAVPLLALGFSPMTFVVLTPFTATYAVLLHANLNWSFGRLGHVVASPVFHRWHHARGEGEDKNFSGILPCWDVLFGTFHLPAGRAPAAFGVEDAVAAGFWAQLLHPFRALARPPAAVRRGSSRAGV